MAASGAESASSGFGRILAEKLADSLTSPLPKATSRRLYLSATLPGKVSAVIGIRRAGKTTFLHQVRRGRLEKGQPQDRLPYVNFEDERLGALAPEHLTALLDEYYRRYPAYRGKERVTWCLDEIQLVPGWERFARRLLDTEKVDLLVSGSSAALLSREIATALRGRSWTVVIHPFSFEESIRHKGGAVPSDPKSVSARERSGLERSLLDYLSAGGFPEAQGIAAADRFQLLSDYVDVAILRDVMERHGVTNIAGLRWLVRHLLGNAAGLFSVEKFYAALKSQGYAIAKDTVHELVSYLEDCFLIRTVWMESTSDRQRMVNPRKAYPVDPGFIPIFDRSGKTNVGHALETAVLLELERRGFAVSYVRTSEGREVDFLARSPEGKQELIQVCADPGDAGTLDRELQALAEAGRAYPTAARRLLTLTGAPVPGEVPPNVIIQPAYEWLLSPP
jgi:predicted AAA+ superfamily ATPase